MGRYSVEVRDAYGRLVTVLLRAQKKQFSVYRNRPGSCQFTLDLYDPQATTLNLKLNQYDIVFRREGTPVFAGQISYLDPKIDGDTKTVDVIATGYFDLFDQRFVTSDYPGYDALHDQLPFASTDASQVAWTLVNDAQFPLSSDGSQTSTGTNLTLAQSFVAPGTANLTTLKLLLTNTSATGNLVVSLYTDFNGAPSNVQVPNSQKTIAVAGISSTLSWYEIDYTGTLPALTQGATYWIEAYLDTTQSGSNGIYWSYLNNDYYINGRAYCLQNPSLFTTGQDLQFFALLDDNSFQMTKNTYLGITQGNLPTSYNITPVYSRFKKIKDAVEGIANTYNGIDFSVSFAIDSVNDRLTKTFNTYYPRQGVDNTNLNFSYPGNIKKLEKPKDGKTMVNEVAMRGQGSGVNQLTVIENDSASIQAYGQRQDVEQESDVSNQSTLQLLGQELIRVRKDPLDLPNIVLDGNQAPHIGDFGVGDQITFNISEVPIMQDLSQVVYRIEQIDVTISDNDLEEVNLTVSLA